MSSSFRALLLSAVAAAALAALQAAGQVAQAQGGVIAWPPILATGLVAFLTSLLLSLFHLELPSAQQAAAVGALTQLLDAHTAPAVPLAVPIRRADLAAVPVPGGAGGTVVATGSMFEATGPSPAVGVTIAPTIAPGCRSAAQVTSTAPPVAEPPAPPPAPAAPDASPGTLPS